MATFSCEGKNYPVDEKGFLLEFNRWDEDFAKGMAPEVHIRHELAKEHWDVVYYVRDTYREEGRCPTVYETCRMTEMNFREMQRLFPTGYRRGACRLSGITSKAEHVGLAYHPASSREALSFMESYDKVYEVDVRGFLLKPEQWDENYAIHKAHETKVHDGKLTDKHWEIIRFLRDRYEERKEAPTVYETCEANQIDQEELERLFPDGYHRGALKIAGLHVI